MFGLWFFVPILLGIMVVALLVTIAQLEQR